MKNQPLFLAMAMAGGFSLVTTGCILGSDPDHNSMVFGSLGGSTGTAGTTGGAGTTGAGGSNLNTVVGTPLATFDTTVESFSFSTYPETPNLATNNNGTAPTIEWDSADASPSGGGSLKVTAPYYGANQYVDIQSPSFPMSMLRNWTGGKLHVRVRVDPGSTFMGQIEPYVDTTPPNFDFVGSSFNAMPPTNDWHDYSVPLETAMTRISGYDLKQVILFGVHIGSGTAGANQKPVTFHIDTFTIEGVVAPPAPDAGSD
jgi:hypothetical protein